MTKKSYLSKQLVAVIVILTVLVISIPLYFFVLNPMLSRKSGNNTEKILPPKIEGETVSSSSGMNIIKITEGEEQEYFLHNGTESWSIYKTKTDGKENWVIRGYEASATNGSLLGFLVNSLRSPYAISRVAPDNQTLETIRKEMADAMSEEELEKVGGLNGIAITNDQLKDYDLKLEDYGFEGDLSALPRIITTDAAGVTHTIYLGNTSPDGSSRYAMYEGRPAVYLLSDSSADFLTMEMLDLVSTNIFVAPADPNDYIPDLFQIEKNGELFIDIKKLPANDVLAMDRATLSLVYKKISDDITNIYDTSPEYVTMLNQLMCADISGDRVLALTPTVITIEDGKKVYKRQNFTVEQLLEYGIDGSLKFSYEKDGLVNYLDFSAPMTDEKQRTYYNVFVYTWDTIVKVYTDSVPFMEKEEEYFISPFISTMSIDNLAYLTVDSSTLKDLYVNESAGLVKLKETFTLSYRMTAGGSDRVLVDDAPVLENVLLSDGTVAQAPSSTTSGAENFRRLYRDYIGIQMYTDVKTLLNQIEQVDLDAPDVTVTCGVYGGGKHVMHFYFFGESGNLCFYTYDSENARYVVSATDVARVIQAANQLKNGEKVTTP